MSQEVVVVAVLVIVFANTLASRIGVAGPQLFGIVEANTAADEGIGIGFTVAAAAFMIIVLVRAAYVLPMMSVHERWVRQRRRRSARVHATRTSVRSMRTGGRANADIDSFASSPLTWRHSTTALRYVLDKLDAYEINIKLHLESEKL